jgi:hypothetical protein
MQEMFYFNQEKKEFDTKLEPAVAEHIEEEMKEPLFFKIVSGPEKKALDRLKRQEEIDKAEAKRQEELEKEANAEVMNKPAESARAASTADLKGQDDRTLQPSRFSSPNIKVAKDNICMWDLREDVTSLKKDSRKYLPPLKNKPKEPKAVKVQKPPLIPTVTDNIKRDSSLLKRKAKKSTTVRQYNDAMKFLRPSQYRPQPLDNNEGSIHSAFEQSPSIQSNKIMNIWWDDDN